MAYKIADSFFNIDYAFDDKRSLLMILSADFSFVILFLTKSTTPNAPTPSKSLTEKTSSKSLSSSAFYIS